MTSIVCLSCDPWQSIPTRTQQLMTRLRGAEVLFFEPAADKDSREHKKPGRKVRPQVTVYTLPPISAAAERNRFFFRRGYRRQGDYIQSVLEKRRIKEPLLWCTSPKHIHLLDFLAYRGLVYDCDRYWTGLPMEWESDLALNSDVIFAASGGLVDRLSPCCDNIALVPNGCNYPMFTRSDLEVPHDLEGVGHPLLGYVGTLWSDLDYSPIFACAAAHPDWNFLLLGRQQKSEGLRRLREMKRVILADRHPLIEVPDYVSQCDVCLDLRRTGVAGNDVVSTRVYEYMAAGKPVVRHTFPGQMDDFPGMDYTADDTTGFVIACEEALRDDGPWLRGRRRDNAEYAAWDQRAEEVEQILEANAIYGG